MPLPEDLSYVQDVRPDALGLIGQLLDTVRPGHVAKPAPKPSDGLNGYRTVRGGSASWRVM